MINLDLALIITVAVLFLFMIRALNGMLFKPMVKHMDARKKSLSENQLNASQSSGDANELIQEGKKVLDDGKHEAHKYLETEIAKQKEENAVLLNKVKMEIEEELKSFRQDLELEEEKVKQVIANDRASLTEAIKIKLAV
jgi:F0F1-type ATP synthase membrane subunit b/b'